MDKSLYSVNNNPASLIINTSPKVKILDFEFRQDELRNPMFIALLAMAIDPTEKQKLVLDASQVVIHDANNKVVYPPEVKVETVEEKVEVREEKVEL